jgi:hypothetical protein
MGVKSARSVAKIRSDDASSCLRGEGKIFQFNRLDAAGLLPIEASSENAVVDLAKNLLQL